MVVSVSAAVLNQEVVDDGLVLDVIVGDRQELRLPLGEPLPRRRPLTLQAVAVAAGIVGDARMRAVLAALDVSAERRRPAGLDCGAACKSRPPEGVIGVQKSAIS